jgi:hypothetical protein
MQCEKCSYIGPEGKTHYHIVIENGVITTVWFISGDGYWDRELEKDEWFVENKDDAVKLHHVKKPKPVKKPKRLNQDWLIPKVYKGKSMHEEEVESQS